MTTRASNPAFYAVNASSADTSPIRFESLGGRVTSGLLSVFLVATTQGADS